MNIFGRSILLSLALSIAFQVYAQAPAKKLNVIERQYESIKDDIGLVRECYLSKSKCNQEERKETQKALGRLSAKTLALIGTIIGISASVYVGRQMWLKRKEKEKERREQLERLAQQKQQQEKEEEIFPFAKFPEVEERWQKHEIKKGRQVAPIELSRPPEPAWKKEEEERIQLKKPTELTTKEQKRQEREKLAQKKREKKEKMRQEREFAQSKKEHNVWLTKRKEQKAQDEKEFREKIDKIKDELR